MVVKRLIDGRFQFIRVVSTKAYTKTYLMTDHSDAAKPKCIVKHLQLPTHNAITLKFLNGLLARRINLLKRIGDHRTIAKTLATVQEEQGFYWAREYIPGQPLAAELIEGKPWSEAQVQDFLRETLEILDVLQRSGIAHQNLHPSNLIRHNDDGRLVAVDFGLIQDTGAAQLNGDSQDFQYHSPTSGYLPQQLHRQYLRFASDHFALGMMATQLATGLSYDAMPKADQEDFLGQMRLQLKECSTLDRPLRALLLRLVSPDTEQQFHQAKEALEALEALGGGANPSPPDDSRASASDGTGTGAAATSPMDAQETVPGGGTAALASATASRAAARRNHRIRLGWGAGVVLALLAVGGLVIQRLPQGMRVNTLLRQADAAVQRGQRNDAVAYLNQALELQPDHSEALAQRSTLLWENGQSEQALQDLSNAIQAQPDSAALYYQRGNLRFRLGDLQGAIADYSDALQRQDTYVDAHVNRGSARADLGDEAGAVQDYTAAINLATDPETKAVAYLNRCLSISNMGDQAAALGDCTEAVNLRPNNSLAYENRGLVKRRLNDFQGAIQEFTIAIQINAGSPEPYYNRGLTRQDLGDLAGAMVDFNQTIALNPNHPFAYYDRGLLHAELGDLESAIADLETVASACLDVSRLGCFDDAQYQLEQLRAALGSP